MKAGAASRGFTVALAGRPGSRVATPEHVAVYAEYGIGRITLREAAAPVTLVLAARRALAVLRTVELLCDRVPLRTATLFADAYQAAAQIDPAA